MRVAECTFAIVREIARGMFVKKGAPVCDPDVLCRVINGALTLFVRSSAIGDE